jgi:mono/diheme cytochrome c family protein
MGFPEAGEEAVMRLIHRDLMSTIVPVLVVAGLVGLAFHSFVHAQDYPADTARGKAVYQRHCEACHGVGGWGDGPDGQALKVAPANFHRVSSFLKSDEELLRTIEHGVVFSPMHSWRGQLTDGEMQDVVSYIRLLSQKGR